MTVPLAWHWCVVIRLRKMECRVPEEGGGGGPATSIGSILFPDVTAVLPKCLFCFRQMDVVWGIKMF